MGSDRSTDLNSNPLSDVETQIREVAKAVGQTSTTKGIYQAYGGGGAGAGPTYSKVNVRPSVDDLGAIVDTKAQAAAEAAWDDPAELAVHALIHRAWTLELERNGWNPSAEIGSAHIKALRMAQAAIRLIPKREPIA